MPDTVRRPTAWVWFLLAVFWILVACGQVITRFTPTPVATPTTIVLATNTSRPTATPAPATPAPTFTPTITPTPIIYIVQKGDVLGAIAQKFGVTIAALQDANGILDPRRLQVGQELIIPQEEEALLETPTPTPTPMPFDIVNISFHETLVGSLWFLGEVHNVSKVPLEQVQVQVSLYDPNDIILALGTAYTALDLIPPDGRAPFVVAFTDPPTAFAKYQVVPLSGVPAMELPSRYDGLVVGEHQGQPIGRASYRVWGTVVNLGNAAAEHINVVVTAYDEEGRVIGMRQGGLPPELTILSPGASAPFELRLTSVGGPVFSYSVQVEGRRAP